MKKLIIALALILISSITSAQEAGNGGGGDITENENMVPVGELGKLISEAVSPSYSATLTGFLKNFPEAGILTCPDDNRLLYPHLPSFFEDKVQFKVLIERNPIASFFGADNYLEDLVIDNLCASEKRISAYGMIVMLLVYSTKHDPVTMRLLERSNERGGPVVFVVSEHRKMIPVKGGEIEEFSWFDHNTGEIYWSNRRQLKGFAMFTGRDISSFFRHELAHALLFRSIEVYPEVEYWHDWSEDLLGGIMVQDGIPNKRFYRDFRTSKEAAFIEGVANALERGAYMEHPMILQYDDFNHLGGADDGERFFLSDGRRDSILMAPEASEVYVGSAINVLSEGFKPRTPSEIERDGSYYSYSLATDEEMLLHMVDAVAETTEPSAKEFAQSLDRVMQSDIGYRWLREYFFYDYRDGRNISDEFDIERAIIEGFEKPVFWNHGSAVSDERLYFTPYYEAKKSIAVTEAQAAYANQFTDEALLEKINTFIIESDNRVQVAEGEIMTIEDAMAQQDAYKDRWIDDDIQVIDDMARRYQDYLVNEYRIWVDIFAIFAFFGHFKKEGSFEEITRKRDELRQILSDLAQRETEPGTEAHRERAVEMLELRKGWQKNERWLIWHIIVAKCLPEFLRPSLNIETQG